MAVCLLKLHKFESEFCMTQKNWRTGDEQKFNEIIKLPLLPTLSSIFKYYRGLWGLGFYPLVLNLFTGENVLCIIFLFYVRRLSTSIDLFSFQTQSHWSSVSSIFLLLHAIFIES